MPSVMDDIPNHNGANSRSQAPDGGWTSTGKSTNEEYFDARARNRATEAAYDLFEALRAGDIPCALWLLNEVSWRVLSLSR